MLAMLRRIHPFVSVTNSKSPAVRYNICGDQVHRLESALFGWTRQTVFLLFAAYVETKFTAWNPLILCSYLYTRRTDCVRLFVKHAGNEVKPSKPASFIFSSCVFGIYANRTPLILQRAVLVLCPLQQYADAEVNISKSAAFNFIVRTSRLYPPACQICRYQVNVLVSASFHSLSQCG